MPAAAMVGTPVLVVFFRRPVARPARDTPWIALTVVSPWVPVTSPTRLPVKLTAVVALEIWPPLLTKVCQVPAPVLS